MFINTFRPKVSLISVGRHQIASFEYGYKEDDLCSEVGYDCRAEKLPTTEQTAVSDKHKVSSAAKLSSYRAGIDGNEKQHTSGND